MPRRGTEEPPASGLIVTASCPDRRTFVRLSLDPEYRTGFRHRRAAVDRYRAVIAAAPG